MNYLGHRGAIMTAVGEAFSDTLLDLDAHFQSEFDDERWEWDGETIRLSGEVVDSPRDINDLGTLKDSQHISVDDSNAINGQVNAEFIWSDPKATAVFLGESRLGFGGRAIEIPGRNLPVEGLERFKFLPAYVAHARKRLAILP